MITSADSSATGRSAPGVFAGALLSRERQAAAEAGSSRSGAVADVLGRLASEQAGF